MKEYDFVFVYEVKNRELENICLIACELERRGYKVGFIGTWDQELQRCFPLKTKVAIAFALYSDSQLNFIDYHVSDCDKYLNMQWEQVFTNLAANQDETSMITGKVNFYGVSGNAKKAVHIAWGTNTYNRLIEKYNLNEKNIVITGHVALDFLNSKLQSYFLSREDLFAKFGIPCKQKVCLFISSFSYVNMPKATMEWLNNIDNGNDPNVMATLSIKSQELILMWIEKLLIDNKEMIFIYRPHPAENDNPVLKKMSDRFQNFMVIDEYSIKQWIVVVDKIYTWISTAIAEVYAADKPCGILRPVEIPYNYDMEIYNNASYISDYEVFRDSVDSEMTFPVDKKLMDYYYHIDKDYPAFMKVCDLLEKMYMDDSYYMNCSHGVRTPESISDFNRYMRWKHKLIKSNKGRAILNKHYPNRNNDLDKYNYTLTMYRKNHSTQTEIDQIMKKLKEIIDKEYQK